MYPVWINDGKNPKPKEGIFYEVAANGTFLHKQMPFWLAVVPVDRISVLQEGIPDFQSHIPPFPASLVAKAVRFFAWICREYDSEAIVLVYFNEAEQRFFMAAPKQTVSAASISYDFPKMDLGPGWAMIGTMHSHGKLSAFHSGTDLHDEESLDGIHVTFGDFPRWARSGAISISVEAAVNGHRFPLRVEDVLRGLRREGGEEEAPRTPGEAIVSPEPLRERSYWSARSSAPTFTLENKEEILPADYAPPPVWLARVNARNIFPRSFRDLKDRTASERPMTFEEARKWAQSRRDQKSREDSKKAEKPATPVSKLKKEGEKS
mgnify:CR=1 FL=1